MMKPPVHLSSIPFFSSAGTQKFAPFFTSSKELWRWNNELFHGQEVKKRKPFSLHIFAIVFSLSWDNVWLCIFKKEKGKEDIIKIIIVQKGTLFITHFLPAQMESSKGRSLLIIYRLSFINAGKSLQLLMVWHCLYIWQLHAESHSSRMGRYTLGGDGRGADADPGPCCAEAQFWGIEPALLSSLNAWQSPHSHVAQCQWCTEQITADHTLQVLGWAKFLRLFDSPTRPSAAAIILPMYPCW